MSKPKKVELLQVGQRVWIESTPQFYQGERSIAEYEIVEANKNSAYAVHVNNLTKEKKHPLRIEQKSRKVIKTISIGYAYYFWATKEEFEQNVTRQEDTQVMRMQAIEKVKKMNYEQLQAFLSN